MGTIWGEMTKTWRKSSDDEMKIMGTIWGEVKKT